jgi:hypothetical protein
MKSRQRPTKRTFADKIKDRWWSESKPDAARENRLTVYEAILSLREATINQISEILKKRRTPLSLRTIEQSVKSDSRIIKNKRRYSIEEWARVETRFLNPKRFGLQMWNDVILSKAESYLYDEATMKRMIETFGAIILFAFIEASRKVHDKPGNLKNEKDYRDRNNLVLHWAMNSVPLDFMFRTFASVFNYRTAPGIPIPPIEKPDGLARDEMNELQIRECLSMLEKNYPDMYKDLVNAKKTFYENSLALEKNYWMER